jgi:hypothetical protein
LRIEPERWHIAIAGGGDFEERAFADAEQGRDKVGGEALNRRVKLAHGAVVEAPGHFDFVFGLRESFSAILRRMRRMILPERVLGRPGANWIMSGEAIGPISLRT